MKNDNKAFTLIELLVCITIPVIICFSLAVLAGIGYLVYWLVTNV